MTTNIELDPEDPFDSIVLAMVKKNREKRADYAGDDHWLQNFYDSAYQANVTAGTSCEVLIGTKQARLRVLLSPKAKAPKNESVEDTLLDRAVYSVLALGLWNEGGYEKKKLICSFEAE